MYKLLLLCGCALLIGIYLILYGWIQENRHPYIINKNKNGERFYRYGSNVVNISLFVDILLLSFLSSIVVLIILVCLGCIFLGIGYFVRKKSQSLNTLANLVIDLILEQSFFLIAIPLIGYTVRFTFVSLWNINVALVSSIVGIFGIMVLLYYFLFKKLDFKGKTKR